jgi:hypothetical protein
MLALVEPALSADGGAAGAPMIPIIQHPLLKAVGTAEMVKMWEDKDVIDIEWRIITVELTQVVQRPCGAANQHKEISEQRHQNVAMSGPPARWTIVCSHEPLGVWTMRRSLG